MEEGFVSKHLNRHFSRPLATWLAPTRVTPNQVSFASFAIALAAATAFAADSHVIGGALAQSSSILDGVDGDLARAQGTATPLGAFWDAVLDRYADAAIIVGMTAAAHNSYAYAWLIGAMALTGSLMVSYTRTRSEAGVGVRFHSGLTALGTRDVRLALICLGALAGQILLTLVILAALTNVVVIARILAVFGTRR